MSPVSTLYQACSGFLSRQCSCFLQHALLGPPPPRAVGSGLHTQWYAQVDECRLCSGSVSDQQRPRPLPWAF